MSGKKTPKGARNMSVTLTYIPYGDYLLPNLKLNEPPKELTEPLGKYGRMRKAFLKEHREITYNTMLLSETLFPHLREIEQAATSRMEQIIAALKEKNPLPDKSVDPMGWATAMDSLRDRAEEVILHELIHTL